MHEWLINHKILGPYIKNYMEHRAVKRGVKIYALALLWTSLTIDIILLPKIILKIILAAIGIAVSIHILKLKTLK